MKKRAWRRIWSLDCAFISGLFCLVSHNAPLVVPLQGIVGNLNNSSQAPGVTGNCSTSTPAASDCHLHHIEPPEATGKRGGSLEGTLPRDPSNLKPELYDDITSLTSYWQHYIHQCHLSLGPWSWASDTTEKCFGVHQKIWGASAQLR